MNSAKQLARRTYFKQLARHIADPFTGTLAAFDADSLQPQFVFAKRFYYPDDKVYRFEVTYDNGVVMLLDAERVTHMTPIEDRVLLDDFMQAWIACAHTDAERTGRQAAVAYYWRVIDADQTP